MVKGCILPWIHLFGDIRGDYRLCCHIPANDHDRSDVLATHKDSIASIWNNNYYKKTRLQFLDSKNTTESPKTNDSQVETEKSLPEIEDSSIDDDEIPF